MTAGFEPARRTLTSQTTISEQSTGAVDLKKGGSLRLNSSSAAKTLRQIHYGTLKGTDSRVSSLYTERLSALSKVDKLGTSTSSEMISLLKLEAAMKGDESKAALKSSILPSSIDFAVKGASAIFVQSDLREDYSKGVDLLRDLHKAAKATESSLDSIMGHIFSNKTTKGGLEADKAHYNERCDRKELKVKLALAFIEKAKGGVISDTTIQEFKSKGVPEEELNELRDTKSLKDVFVQNPNLKNLFDRTESFLKLKLNEIGSIRGLIQGGYLDSVYALKDSKIAVQSKKPDHLQTLVDSHNKIIALRNPVEWDDSQLRVQLDYANSKVEALGKDAFALKGEEKKAFAFMNRDPSPTQIRDKFNTPQKAMVLVKALDQRLKYLNEFLENSPSSENKTQTQKEIAIIIGNMMRSATTRALLTDKHLEFFKENSSFYVEFLEKKVNEATNKGGPVSPVILSYARELHWISGPEDKNFLELAAARSARKGAEPLVDLQKAMVRLKESDLKSKTEIESLFNKSLISILKNSDLLSALKEDVNLLKDLKDHFSNQTLGNSKQLMKQLFFSNLDPRVLFEFVDKSSVFKSLAPDILLAAKSIIESSKDRSVIDRMMRKDPNIFVRDVKNQLMNDIPKMAKELNENLTISVVDGSPQAVYQLLRGEEFVVERLSKAGPVPTTEKLFDYPNLRQKEMYTALLQYREGTSQYTDLVASHGKEKVDQTLARLQLVTGEDPKLVLEKAGLTSESDVQKMLIIYSGEKEFFNSYNQMFESINTLRSHVIDIAANIKSLEQSLKTLDDSKETQRLLTKDKSTKDLTSSDRKLLIEKNRAAVSELLNIQKLYLIETQKLMDIQLAGIKEKLETIGDKPLTFEDAKDLYQSLARNVMEANKPENLNDWLIAIAANSTSKADLDVSFVNAIYSEARFKVLTSENTKTPPGVGQLFHPGIMGTRNFKTLTVERQRIYRTLIKEMEKIKRVNSSLIPFAKDIQNIFGVDENDQEKNGTILSAKDPIASYNTYKGLLD